MNFKGPVKIDLSNSFAMISPSKFENSRLEWANPIGRGLAKADSPSGGVNPVNFKGELKFLWVIPFLWSPRRNLEFRAWR